MAPLEATFVFLPGLGEDHRSFKHQMAAFPNSYAADWIDPLPSESLEKYAVRFAGSIRTELSQRPPSPIIVCGHSLGGMVAPYIARELGASGCVLLASIRKPDQFPRRYYCLWLLLSLCPPLQLALLFLGQLFARIFLCFPWFWQWFISPKVVRAFVKTPLFRLSRLFRMMFHWAYRRRKQEENVELFDKPTLQIHGTCDWQLPIRRTNPDFRIDGGGHLLTITHPEIINEVIGHFAEELRLSANSVDKIGVKD
jgi:pimeloyl-ACP methyl ester carboxylesterase